MTKKLSPTQVYQFCDPAQLGCSTSAEFENLDTIIGQERAVRALRFGLDIQNKGFNIYVSGIPGSGRTTATERYLNEFASKMSRPDDWIYVNNFHDPLKPNAIRLPAGKAIEFQKDMEQLVKNAIDDLQSAFESNEYSKHREKLVNDIQTKKQELLNELNNLAKSFNFVLQPTPMGLLAIPAKDGNPLTEEEVRDLSSKERADIGERQQQVKQAMEAATREAQDLDKNLRELLEKMDKEVAEFAIQHHFEALKTKYKDLDEIPHHIEHVRLDMLENIEDLTQQEEESQQVPVLRRRPRQEPTRKYAVNVLVDNSALTGAPVILEMNPIYHKLIGRVEQEALFGALITDFTLIRSGSLHRANGGFLVLPVLDLLQNPFAWEGLKRALENEQIEIEDLGERYGFATKSLRPENIPLEVKVVLIGRRDLYQLLLMHDEQFGELFKVKADFDTEMDRTDQNIKDYMAFVCTLCNTENLRHLDRFALARIVEHGSREVADQTKLSTHFGNLSDVIREASYYATIEQSKQTTAAHVNQAIEERFYRSSLVRDRIQELIAKDVIKIDTTQEVIGQVNGLSVLTLGDISFGQPNRITASISVGKAGVINIEREAEMSGPIHTKGVLILSGFLSQKYAQDKPLSFDARIVFEQSYSGVEGDSASSTELYALLSALAELPIQQGIAVTGSVNQKGEIQAIGGVNEKVEGYFEVCSTKGLTGDQGVLIPESNVKNLMLKQEVREAIEAEQFHIWSVSTVDEGIEILTGTKAGDLRPDGTFTPDSVNARVNSRLKSLAEKLEKFGESLAENMEDNT